MVIATEGNWRSGVRMDCESWVMSWVPNWNCTVPIMLLNPTLELESRFVRMLVGKMRFWIRRWVHFEKYCSPSDVIDQSELVPRYGKNRETHGISSW